MVSKALQSSPIGLNNVVGSGANNFPDISTPLVLNLCVKYFSSRPKPISDLRSTILLRNGQYSAQPTFVCSANSL